MRLACIQPLEAKVKLCCDYSYLGLALVPLFEGGVDHIDTKEVLTAHIDRL